MNTELKDLNLDLLKRFAWTENNLPTPCLIDGDKTTRINLGWFKKEKECYILTDEGMKNYKILQTNV